MNNIITREFVDFITRLIVFIKGLVLAFTLPLLVITWIVSLGHLNLVSKVFNLTDKYGNYAMMGEYITTRELFLGKER